MLIRFDVANFRSISAPVELSMVAVDRDRREAREARSLGESLLAVAAIYGPNASGKTNIVAALTWLRTAVRESLRYWDEGIPVEPFAFGDAPAKPTQFTVESLIGDVRYEYVVELDREQVTFEALFHYPEGRRRRVFEREGADLRFQRGLGHLAGTRDLLTPRSLALSIARRFDEPLVSQFVSDLLAGQSLGLKQSTHPRRWLQPPVFATDWVFDQSDARPGESATVDSDVAELRRQALALLKLADLGIDDVIVDERPAGTALDQLEQARSRRRLRLVHRTAEQSLAFDFASESEGTRTWFQLIGPVLLALNKGTHLLFDELDASLHPTLSAELIRLFHDPETNPRGAQLIFTTHDTSLLNHLNRDEVWLTEKAADGSTRLGALAEFAGERVRRSINIEKAYLHGRFGALPEADRAELLRELGLIG